MASNVPQVIATELYMKSLGFLESLDGKKFPSIYQDHDDIMFSFQVAQMDNTFQVAAQASQVGPGQFLLNVTYSFMTHAKTSGDITILPVPLYGTYIFNSDIDEVESEEELFTKIYEVILDKLQEAVMTILS